MAWFELEMWRTLHLNTIESREDIRDLQEAETLAISCHSEVMSSIFGIQLFAR
jgi:hypothetical protein